MNRIIGCVRSSLSVQARKISVSTNLAKANAGKAKNYGVPGQNRKQWYWVTLKSMAGTGNTMTWVRHEKDPKVVILHPDPKLDKDAYPDNKVLWVETKRGEKVWPYNLRQMKFIMGQVGDKRLIKDNPRYSAPWHRPMGADQVAERLNSLMQNQEEKTKMTVDRFFIVSKSGGLIYSYDNSPVYPSVEQTLGYPLPFEIEAVEGKIEPRN